MRVCEVVLDCTRVYLGGGGGRHGAHVLGALQLSLDFELVLMRGGGGGMGSVSNICLGSGVMNVRGMLNVGGIESCGDSGLDNLQQINVSTDASHRTNKEGEGQRDMFTLPAAMA